MPTEAEIEAAKNKAVAARNALLNTGAGKHNGLERNYGRAYDLYAQLTGAWRLKKKYR